MQQFIQMIISYEKQLEYCRQDLAIDQEFSLQYFPETVTLIQMHQMFQLNAQALFYRYDSDKDGKLTQQQIIQIAQPRQTEYMGIAKSNGNYGKLKELLQIIIEYEEQVLKLWQSLNFIEIIDDSISIKKYISNQFYRATDRDLWLLNNRIECEKLSDLMNYFKQQNE